MSAPDFYAACANDRTYAKPIPKQKHHRQFDCEFWRPARCRKEMSFLELGCGTGLFLAYLQEKGALDFVGVDQEQSVLSHMPPKLAAHVRIQGIGGYLESARGRTFDRIAMFDVFEHFSPTEGVALLVSLQGVLAKDGLIVIRVPNMESPWGARHQFGDLTHKAAYTPDSICQAALAAELDVVQCLPARRGRPWRQLTQAGFETLLGLMLTDGPKIWTATFAAILKRKP